MTDQSLRVLEHARDRLRRDGVAASQFLVVGLGTRMLAAATAIDEVLERWRGVASGGERDGLRLAAHRALGALEVVSTRMQVMREGEAYSVLVGVAYS